MSGLPTTIEARQAALEAFHLQVFGPPPAPRPRLTPNPATRLDDQEVLTRARNAKNGAKFSALYDHVPPTPDPRASEDDLALGNQLAFFTQDPAQLRRLFEGSARRRVKWDERRGTSTWLDEYVIDKALADVRETYSGGRHWDVPSTPSPDLTPHHAEAPPEPVPIMAGGATCGHCPLAQAPTRIAQLEARVRELEAESRRLHDELTTARHELAQVDGERADIIRVVNNPHLKHEHRTLLATVFELDKARKLGQLAADGSARIPVAAIAETSGQSDDTVSKHLKRTDERYGLLRRHYTRTDDGHLELHVRMANDVQDPRAALRTLARWAPPADVELMKHGGKRTPRCPSCPEAVIREEHRFVCTGCGTVLLEDVTEHPPAEATPHHAGRPHATAPSPVPPTTSVEESYLETASCGVAEATAAAPRAVPVKHCDQCGRPFLVSGQPSCVHSPDPPADWPRLEVAADPPPRLTLGDDGVWFCTRH
jgi:hypothetical protein